MSISTDPKRARSTMPPGPRYISSTSVGKPSMVMTYSASATALPAESCQNAPSSNKGCAFSRVRLWTWSVWPARSRWVAMLRPITPVPMKAMEWEMDITGMMSRAVFLPRRHSEIRGGAGRARHYRARPSGLKMS